jgi:integrase
MEVFRDNTTLTRSRNLTRFYIDCRSERAAGRVPAAYIRKDRDGRVFTTKKAATDFLKIVEAELHRDGGLADAARTFGDAHRLWVQLARAGCADKIGKQKSVCHLISISENHILGFKIKGVPIADVRLIDLTFNVLRDEISLKQLRTLELGASSKKKLLQIFKRIFQTAVDERWIAQSPATSLKGSFDATDPLDQAIDAELYGKYDADIPQLFAALEVIAPEYLLPLETLRRTGVRISELRAITQRSITLHNSVAKIRIDRAWKDDKILGKPKNGTSRDTAVDVAFGQRLLAHALESKRRDNVPLFGVGNQPLNEDSVRRAWQQAQFAVRGWGFFRSSNSRDKGRAYRLVKLPKRISELSHEEWKQFAYGQAGLAKGDKREGLCFRTKSAAAAHINLHLFALHSLRHLYASKLASSGTDIHKVAQRIGDSVETTQRHYVHFFPLDETDDLEAIAAIG